MTAEVNKQAVRRYFEDYHNRRETALLHELVSDELAAPTAAAQTAVERAFPDYHISVDWQVADDDAVATGWSAEGTHSGPWTSPAGTVEATGRPNRWTATTTARIRDGRIRGAPGTPWVHLGML